MTFEELFREKYRVALHAARENDKEKTIAGLEAICVMLDEQYNKKNNDPIKVKAKLGYWRDTFDKYAKIIRLYGMEDRRVQKLFGLIDDDVMPTLSDVLAGKAEVDVAPIGEQAKDVGGGVSFEGIIPPQEIAMPEEKAFSGSPFEKIPFEMPEEKEVVPESPVSPDGVQEEIGAGTESEMPQEGDDVNGEQEHGGETIAGPAFSPDTLRGFIGQQHIIKPLLKEIAIAKQEGRKHLDNILLFGNPGLGKTTIMELIAKELGVAYEFLDCSQFRNSQQSLKALQNFFMRVARLNQPVVIAFDEIHMLNKELQSSLLTLLNNRVYCSPLDVNGRSVRIPIEEFTFIAATTDDQDVLDTIKNRCLRLTFQLVDYTPEELRIIYRNKVAAKGFTITEEAIDLCIPRSRGAIRYVNANVDGMIKELYNDEGILLSKHIDADTAQRYFKEKKIGRLGLSEKDFEILRTIQEESSGSVSADVLASKVGLDVKKYLSEYERYLLKIGFISVSGKGRSLTEKAIKFLNEEDKK